MGPGFGNTVAHVTDETFGQQVRRRRELLGLSARQFAEAADVHRNTLAKVENDADGVEELTKARILKALDRLEKLYGTDDPERMVSHIKLPNGTEVWFEGSPDGVAEMVAKFLADRD